MDTQPSPVLVHGFDDYYDDETQAVDVDCEQDFCTQLFDDQLVVDTDNEGTNKTKVLGHTEALSHVDCVKRVDSHSVGQETMLQTALHKHNGGDYKDIQNTEECNTGPVLKGFTSLRVASIRSSGLAARNMSSKRTNNTPCYSISDGQHQVESSGTSVVNSSLKVLGQIEQRYDLEEHDDRIKESGSENKCRVGKSAVRKLLYEDISHEKGLNMNINNADKEENFPPVCISERELAGLSYVDSQEPGEASQTIALDFVDKFLKVNVIEFDQEAEIIKSTGGKSKPLLGAKGTQYLAKRANRICSASGGTFDWDDYQEDEGGAEFFRKKKVAYFDDGRKAHQSLPQPWDSKRLNSKNCWAVKENGDKVEQQDISSNVAGLFYSDSKLLLHKPKKIDKSMKVTENSIGHNLIKKLNDAKDGMVETGTQKDNPDMLDIGVDTQLAADAMEALCNGVGLNDNNSNVANQDAEIQFPSTAKRKHRKRSESDKDFVPKRASHTLGSAVTTRQSNQTKSSGTGLTKGSSILSEQQSIKVRKQFDETKDMCSLRCELIEESMNEKELERGVIGENVRCLVAASSGKKTLQKRCAKEQLNNYLPIACRTRHKASNQTQRDTKTSTVSGEVIDNLSAPIAPKRKRSRAALNTPAREKCAEFKFIQPGHLKKTKVTHTELSDLKISGTMTVRKGTVNQKLSKKEIHGMANSKIKLTEMKSLEDICTPKSSAYMTPKKYTKPINEASPLCMGKEYPKQSSRKKLLRSPLKKEVSRIIEDEPESSYTYKDLRKRRDMTQVQVLFSQHLDGDIIKQQKKVLSRFGASVAASITDATHFVADEFVRTRNMLEAIAYGKPVVTHFWLESCGQASCLIDERNYILRDARKEKEIGFSLPGSLARACQHPLLQAVERIGRSAPKDEIVPIDSIILSCEEDYADCVPFLEKGASVYSSELLLNGIVIQKLEYERHRLFAESVK